ncbi:hypothetical protein AB0C18_13170 [Nonomuraea muscovyensis]|uniref:hypothetical protein n=1 Tax=Nonomuraea muscovyensis TaxID=1124761 RepID=UPI0033E8B7D5|nr:hypothetical protein [Nonomuraea muscovyensis]
MRKIIAVGLGTLSALFTLTLFAGSAQAGGSQGEVSERQYRILLAQCRHADAPAVRTRCRASVRASYRVGRADPTLDCRTYSGVTVCGVLPLSEAERACIDDSVAGGLSYRRAEVECYVL